jgi:restriction system protein
MLDDAYHFPPDLIELLIDTIPLLCRSKQDVLIFLRGCGVERSVLADLQQRVAADRSAISKYEITRTVLARINEGGDRHLGQRRQVIKRVTEFQEFSACWPSDQLKAKGLVASIRDIVNVKDSFTRMSQERENERREHLRQRAADAEAKRVRRTERDDLRRRLAGLRQMSSPRERGLAFEAVLNDIFVLDGLKVRESFILYAENGQAGEQIDGLILLDGQPVLVEAKWHATPLGVNDVSRHLVRVYGRPAGVHGLIISASEFGIPAVEECKRALTQRVIMLAEINELLRLLEEPDACLRKWLSAKYLAASVDRQPIYHPSLDTVINASVG